ncbi:DUF2812 domain-containing protein [Sporosarcina highlanderae]|uniref:DUF2812 domain-containing protein n=1 Tax=Sporosarcina highlanderae TaxID=3035916 RepID=A0ABT8JQA8_9BACL|nr:DUF2812 domain-containing protein [Sporosarcina highlanderae]MDN4607249.1 DUF2812 domain-containing protein [Sporosarcina highlanderae]
MGKLVYKVRPNDYWRIGEHENWFEEMAAKGLHLKKLGKMFATFEKGEPKQMKYRIDISIDRKISKDQLDMYAESGWQYVTRDKLFYVFSSPVEVNAPELHTDSAEQSFTIEKLDQKLMGNAIFTVVATILMIGMLSAIWFLEGTPIYVLIEGWAIQQTILAAFIGYTAYTSLRATLSIRALRKNLMEEKPVNRHATWTKRDRLRSAFVVVFTIFIGLSAAIPVVQLVKNKTITLPRENVDLPIVRLADIERNPHLIREEPEYMNDGVDWGNRYSVKWSPFAPVQYDTDEGGVVLGKEWSDGSGQYSPSVHTKVYQLTLPAMADSLIADLVKWHQYDENKEDYVEVNHPDLDRLVVYEGADTKKIFASKGKGVIFVRYYGDAETNTIVDEIEKKMKLIAGIE